MRIVTCKECGGACCKKAFTCVDYAVILDSDEMYDYISDEHPRLRGVGVIPYIDDMCIYLNQENNTCSIYETRPKSCREFDCTNSVEGKTNNENNRIFNFEHRLLFWNND